MWLNPHPDDMVVVRQLAAADSVTAIDAYTVPPGKIFVLVALGSAMYPLDGATGQSTTRITKLYVNGDVAMAAGITGHAGVFFPPAWPVGLYEYVGWALVPDCVAFPAGTVFRVIGHFGSPSTNVRHGRAFGYLVPA